MTRSPANTPASDTVSDTDIDTDSGGDSAPARRPLALALSLIILGAIGFVAAFMLTLDKFALLENPDAQLGCNFSVLVGCSTNLNSAQGEVFGFPNSLLGIVFWTATITIGAALLAGTALARWFWVLYALATAGSLALVIWFISESLFVLHVLCPWCMVTWAVTIPTFFVVVLHAMRSGVIPLPPATRRFASAAFGWIPLMTLVSYLIIAVLAQWKLDVLNAVFG